MIDLIQKLTEAWGPSGFEHQVRALIRAEVQSLADEIRVDALGNLICRMGRARPGGKRIMVAAHMDEIGLIVSHVDKLGRLRFSGIGALYPTYLAAGRVKFENGVIGVIMPDPTHDLHRLPGLNGFYIDVSTGGDSQAEVGVGDAAIMWRKFEARGEHLVAKSMDDRVGCAIAIEAMRALKLADSPHEVYFVFTVQEEVGVRGAGVSAFGVQPEAAIALDVTIAGHSARGAETNVQLGAGAAIKALDAKHIPSPLVKNWMIATAQAQNIPYQMEVLTGGSTDGAAIEGVHAGVPTGVISIPCRYVHSPSETVNMADVAACTDLLVALLSHPTPALMPEL